MGRFPTHLRETIARNIRRCRLEKFPGRGGGKKCAEAFGTSPQQWSPWERGMRTPDEERLELIASFFGKTVEWMRTDHSGEHSDEPTQDDSRLHEPSSAAISPRSANYQLLCEIMNHAAQLQALCARALSESIGTAYPPAGSPPPKREQ